MANFETRYANIIKEIAAEENIQINSFDDWAFCLSKDGKRTFIYGYQFGLDSGAVSQVLKDKAAAYEMMKAVGIDAVPHFCVMNPLYPEFSSLNSSWDFVKEKLLEYGRLVLKDNQGTGGRSVVKVSDMAETEKAFQNIFQTAMSLAVSPYIKIDAEYRAVVLDGEVRLLFRKDRPSLTGDGVKTVAELFAAFLSKCRGKSAAAALSEEMGVKVMRLSEGWNTVLPRNEKIIMSWRHNLGQGAVATVLDEKCMSDEMKKLIESVSELFGLGFASIDMVDTAEGLKVLEVNGGVMMENIAGFSKELYDKAKAIYRDAILKALK